jgi:hypothetical protein
MIKTPAGAPETMILHLEKLGNPTYCQHAESARVLGRDAGIMPDMLQHKNTTIAAALQLNPLRHKPHKTCYCLLSGLSGQLSGCLSDEFLQSIQLTST